MNAHPFSHRQVPDRGRDIRRHSGALSRHLRPVRFARARRTLLATVGAAAMVTSMLTTPAVASASPAVTDSAVTDVTTAADDDPGIEVGAPGNETMGGGAATKPGAGDLYPAKLANGMFNTVGGNMFDACAAPSLDAMRAWRASPYHTIGIYIGGISRSCAQPNLTPQWIRSTTALGWSHVPIYVGLQPSCATYVKGGKRIPFPHRMSTDETTATAQGREAALDAIVQMRSLGLDLSVPIYLDVEAYPTNNGPCAVGVRAFTSSWTATLHSKGYVSGLYGSASSMIRHAQIWSSQPNYARPDKLWFARWDGVAAASEPVLPDGEWAGSRIKQFAGGSNCVNCTQTWGGVTISIDANYIESFTTAPSYVETVTPRIAWDSGAKRVGTRPVALAMAGRYGVPADATAVVLNVQIAAPIGDGELIVEPYRGGTKYTTQQFQKGQYVSTAVVVPVSQKVIQFRTTASASRIIVGVTGYLTTNGSSGIEAVQPRIVWDSKTPTVGQTPAAVAVRGVNGIPTDATAVLLNVQVASPTSSGQLIVEPHGVHSTIGVQQYTKGRSISATVLVPLRDAAVQFRLSAGNARVIVSTLGYLSPASTGRLTATSPVLLMDTINPLVTPAGKLLRVAGRNEVPTNATAALLNVEVVNPAAQGQLVVEGAGSRSNSGVQQFIKGQSISTTVLVPLNDGLINLRVSAGKARVIVTSLGYVTPQVAVPDDSDYQDW